MHTPAIAKLPDPGAATPKMVNVDRLNVLEPSSHQSMAPSKARKAVLVGCNLHAMHYICNWAVPSHTALSCESMHLGFDCLHEGHL